MSDCGLQELARCQGWGKANSDVLSKSRVGGALGNAWPLNVSVAILKDWVRLPLHGALP